ncbi:BRCT domain DNA repair protein [Quillaja saponaria]|uniref:BRCT domain DNA repair protein n=1 Tax=Quillaja saponaria TaxID=32244 RepID=A0AAD7VEG1_QUISA|nr:BRCT domain DNA repair protein [Quillaja saponaria]
MSDTVNTEAHCSNSLVHSLSSSSPSANVKDVNGDEYQDTLPLEDIQVLNSPLAETQVGNPYLDTEPIDDPDPVDDCRTGPMCEYEEVVLDSEDEEIRSKEVAIANGLLDDETCRIFKERSVDLQKKQLQPPCEQAEDMAVNSQYAAYVHKKCVAGDKVASVDDVGSDGKMLNYISSQEPGESTQAYALNFVDHYLSLNHMDLCQETHNSETVREKSPHVSGAKGPQRLAKKVKARTTYDEKGTFRWVGCDQNDQEVEISSKTKETSSSFGDFGQMFVERYQKKCNLGNQETSTTDNGCQKKVKNLNIHNDIVLPTCSNSRFPVKSSKEICEIAQGPGMTSKTDAINELDEQLEVTGQQLEASAIGNQTFDMFDIGFNTQIAAEAMEALAYGPPADSSYNDSSPRKSSKTQSVTKKAKSQNLSARNFSTGTSSLRHSENQELKPVLWTRRKVNKNKSSVEKQLICVRSADKNERSSLTIKQKESKGVTGRSFKEFVNNPYSSTCIEQISLEEGQTPGECVKISPQKSGGKLTRPKDRSGNHRERTRDRSSNHRESTNNVTEKEILTYRRKRKNLVADPITLDAKVKRPRSSFRSSRNKMSNKQVQANPLLAASNISFKLDFLNYPRGPRAKRARRNVQSYPNGVANLCTQFVIADGKESSAHPSRVQRSVEAYNSTKKKAHFLSLLSLSSDVDTDRCLLWKNPVEPRVCKDLGRTRSTMQVGELQDINTSSVASGAIGVPLDKNVEQSGSETTSTFGYTEGKKVSNYNYRCHGYHKRPRNQNLPKSSFLKELISLGVPESRSYLTWKDLRQRRDMAYVRILFSQHLDDNIIKQQKKILARLNISIASCSSEATHFVADKFARTRNMLETMALGKLVVTHLWLECCGQANCLIDEKNYILRDAKKEKEIGFSMPVSLSCARQQPLLKGKRILITPNVKPDKEMIASLIVAVHGQVVDESHISACKNGKISDDLLILSCEEDHGICQPFLEEGAAVYSSELLLNGIVIQKLEFKRHQLFINQVNQKCSGTWSSNTGKWVGKVYRRRQTRIQNN